MAEVYQLHVWPLHISPMIGRRLLVRSDTTLYDLHYFLQIAFAWTDSHLHQFLIRGRAFGIAQPGGPWFTDDPQQVQLGDFRFHLDERFLYAYDFLSQWEHQLRVEKTLPLELNCTYPRCIGGQRAAPPEECSGPPDFLARRQHYTLWRVLSEFAEGLKALLEAREDEVGEHLRQLCPLAYWAQTQHRCEGQDQIEYFEFA